MTPELSNKSSRNINSHYYDTRIFNIRIHLQAVKCNFVSGIYVLFVNDDRTKDDSFTVMKHDDGIITEMFGLIFVNKRPILKFG
jgi:hypothetical protein